MKEKSTYKRHSTQLGSLEFYKKDEIQDFLNSLPRGKPVHSDSVPLSVRELIDGRRKEMNEVRKGMAKDVLGIGASYSFSGGMLFWGASLIKNGWAQSYAAQAKVAGFNDGALKMLTQKLTDGDPSTVRAVDQITQNLSANGTEILNHVKNAPYLASQSIHVIKEIVTNVGGSLTNPPITYTSAGIAGGNGVTATVSVAAWHAIVQNSTAGLLVLADNLQQSWIGWVPTLEGSVIVAVGSIATIISIIVSTNWCIPSIKEARQYLKEFKAGISKLMNPQSPTEKIG